MCTALYIAHGAAWMGGHDRVVELQMDYALEAENGDVGIVEERVCCDCESGEHERCDEEEGGGKVGAAGRFGCCGVQGNEEGVL